MASEKLVCAFTNDTDIAVVQKGKTRGGKRLIQLVEFPAWGVIDTGEKIKGKPQYKLLPFLPLQDSSYQLANAIPSYLFTLANGEDEKALLREARAIVAEADEETEDDEDDEDEEEEDPEEEDPEDEDEDEDEEEEIDEGEAEETELDDDGDPVAHIRSR